MVSRSDRVALYPLWMDVPSAEAPAFAGMTGVLRWSRFSGERLMRRDLSSVYVDGLSADPSAFFRT